MNVWELARRTLWSNEDTLSCPEITIPNISKEMYARLMVQATSAGASFDGDTVSMRGLQFSWNYDEPSETLHATCTHRPFFISCDAIAGKISDLIKEARNAI